MLPNIEFIRTDPKAKITEVNYSDQPTEQFRWHANVNHAALLPISDSNLIRAILDDIQTVLASGQTLKRCRARWVSLVDSADGPMVIKMFVERNRWHVSKRAVQQSRALRHVKFANRLSSEGIATPAPVAIFEERRGPLGGNSCLMYPFVKGSTLSTQADDFDQNKSPTLTNSIRNIVQSHLPELGERLVRTGLVHTDVTAENFVKDSSDRLHMIDLDSVRQTRSILQKRRCLQEFRTLAEQIVAGKK